MNERVNGFGTAIANSGAAGNLSDNVVSRFNEINSASQGFIQEPQNAVQKFFFHPTENRTLPNNASPGSPEFGLPGRKQTIGGGFNFGNVGSALQGLSGLASIYFGFKQQKLAKEQLNLSRDAYNTQTKNQASNYNYQLENQAREAASAGGDNVAGVGNGRSVDDVLSKYSI